MLNSIQRKILVVACSSFLISGCETTEQSAALTALGCAGTGVLVGVLTGSTEWGVGAGAACGVAGLLAVQNYHAKQARTYQQDQKLYGYAPPTNSTGVKFRNATSTPEMVKAGDTVKIVADYSVMAPQGSTTVPIKEYLVLKKDGKVFQDLGARTVERGVGGWESVSDFTVPATMQAGTYVIEHKVESGASYDVRQSVFVVAGA
ncbi:MAG: hypothetical protein ACSLFB_13830 [Acidimicrobiales bacterium]